MAEVNASLATRNELLHERALEVFPGGVNSPVRAFGSVGGTPRFYVSGKGATLTDVDGTEVIDLVGAWGPAIVGHAHPEVVDAVQRAAARGLGFGASSPAEIELGEAIIGRVPEVERVRLVSTGTEATMTALRIARGATGRPLVVKFAGHYHGHADPFLAAAGSGLATLALPGSAGVTEETAAQTLVVPYNDPAALEAVFEAHGDRIAAVITEAAAANMGVVAPDLGFVNTVLSVAHRHGALVIADEVLTGFRASAGGYWALERDRQQTVPDLFTFGKVIGGGLPLAALGGRRDLMEHLAPLGSVYQGGTLSGNPIAATAGLTTLALADADAYDAVSAASERLSAAVSAALDAEGVAHRVQRAGTLFSVFFGDFPDGVHNYATAQTQEWWRYAAFFHAMLDGGVALPPSAFEAWFLSAAHDDEVLDRVIAALPVAALAAAAASETSR